MSPQPRGGLLPPHHGDVGEVVGEDGDHAGSAPPEFPPSNLQLQVSVLVFLCFGSALLWETSGDYFIVVFRSKGSFGKKDRRQRSHECQKGGSHTAKESGRVGLSILALRPPLLRLFRSYAFFFPKKNDPRKFSGHLDVVWVPETQKYRK